MRTIIYLLFPLCIATARAELKTLNQFEADLEQALPVLLAEDNLQTSEFGRDKVDAANGWKAFGSLGSGYVQSIVDRGRTYNYTALLGNIGVRHPLLGSADRENQSLIKAEQEIAIKQQDLEWTKRKIRLQLAADYASYWGGQQKQKLTEAYLNLSEPAAELLKQREAKGILLKADRLEAMTAFDRARYENTENQHLMRNALDSMSAYLDRTVDPFDAVKPQFSGLTAEVTNGDVHNHHDLLIIAAMIEAQGEIIDKHNNWRGIESDALLTHSAVLNDPISDLGYGFIASVNVQMPLSIASYREAEKNQANSLLKKLHGEYRLKERELLAQSQAAARRYRRSLELIDYQASRRQSAVESIRERELRLQKLDEDVIEKYFQALYQYYRVSQEFLDAQIENWKARIVLAEFVPSDEAPAPTAADTQFSQEPLLQAARLLPGAGGSKAVYRNPLSGLDNTAVYVWNSAEVMLNPKQFWRRLGEEGVNRILLSLTRAEIDEYAANPGRLRDFIAQGKAQGAAVELLLGEPSWLLTEHRADLLNILASLRNFAFDGLHLDLEINQLKDLDRQQALTAWLETLRAVAALSPWPLAISSHFRYLKPDLPGFACFICDLQQAGVKQIAVMDYVTNPDAVIKQVQPLLEAQPSIRFSVAQSVEKELEPENSYAHVSADRFAANLIKIQSVLKRYPNYAGIVIQSWRDFTEYLNENKIR